jgi:O-antigen ligase
MLTLLLAALVAISGLGGEGTEPVVLFLYRSLLVAIALWCGLAVYRTRPFFVCPKFLTAAAIGSLLMFSFLRAPSTFEGFYFWYQFFLFAVTFVLLAGYSRTQPTTWKYRILALVVGIQAVYVIAGLVSHNRPIMAGFVNPDYLGSFLLVGFSICVSIALFRLERLLRISALIGASFFYFGIIETYSRGATLAAFLILIVAVLRYGRGTSISKIAALAAISVLLVAGALVSPSLVRKFADIRGSSNPYNYMRPKIWAQTLYLIRDNPIFGVGLGQYVYVSRRYAPALEGSVARYAERPGVAHSEYLQYAAETGLPATLLMMGLVGYVMWLAIRRAKTCAPESRAIQEAAILTATGLLSHALVDNNWRVPVMAAGVVVFGLGDVLPETDWAPEIHWTPTSRVAALVLVSLIWIHSAVIPSAGLWYNEQGYRAYASNNLDKAEADYDTATAILPLHAALLDERGMLYLERYSQTQDRRWIGVAEDFFGQAAHANPNFVEPLRHMEKALIWSLTGNDESDSRIHPLIAAVDREVLRIDPFDPFVRKNLAEALYRDGRRREAVEELDRAIQVEPNYISAYLTMAKWEQEAGNAARADQYHQKAMEISAKYRDIKYPGPYERLLLAQPESANP